MGAGRDEEATIGVGVSSTREAGDCPVGAGIGLLIKGKEREERLTQDYLLGGLRGFLITTNPVKHPWTNSISLFPTKFDYLVASRALGSVWFENAAVGLILVIFNALHFIATSFGHTKGRVCNRRVIIKIFVRSYRFTVANEKRPKQYGKENARSGFWLGGSNSDRFGFIGPRRFWFLGFEFLGTGGCLRDLPCDLLQRRTSHRCRGTSAVLGSLGWLDRLVGVTFDWGWPWEAGQDGWQKYQAPE